MPVRVEIDEAELRRELIDGVAPIIRKVTFDIEARIKRSMAGPKSGRSYERGRKGKSRSKRRAMHQASAPGEAPAIDTGTLVNSIRSTFPSKQKGVLDIGANYASYLEEGTTSIRPRPFVEPAIRGALDPLDV